LPWAGPIFFFIFFLISPGQPTDHFPVPGPLHAHAASLPPRCSTRRRRARDLPPTGPPFPRHVVVTHRPPSTLDPLFTLPIFLLNRAESHRHGRARFLFVWLRPGHTSLVPCSNGEASACTTAELSHIEPLPPASPRRDERRCALPPGAILVVPPADACVELTSATSPAPPEMPPFPPPSALWNGVAPLLLRHLHVTPLLG
jgi:hypothetical protein